MDRLTRLERPSVSSKTTPHRSNGKSDQASYVSNLNLNQPTKEDILYLQRTIGNQATLQLIQNRNVEGIQRLPSLTGALSYFTGGKKKEPVDRSGSQPGMYRSSEQNPKFSGSDVFILPSTLKGPYNNNSRYSFSDAKSVTSDPYVLLGTSTELSGWLNEHSNDVLANDFKIATDSLNTSLYMSVTRSPVPVPVHSKYASKAVNMLTPHQDAGKAFIDFLIDATISGVTDRKKEEAVNKTMKKFPEKAKLIKEFHDNKLTYGELAGQLGVAVKDIFENYTEQFGDEEVEEPIFMIQFHYLDEGELIAKRGPDHGTLVDKGMPTERVETQIKFSEIKSLLKNKGVFNGEFGK